MGNPSSPTLCRVANIPFVIRIQCALPIEHIGCGPVCLQLSRSIAANHWLKWRKKIFCSPLGVVTKSSLLIRELIDTMVYQRGFATVSEICIHVHVSSNDPMPYFFSDRIWMPEQCVLHFRLSLGNHRSDPSIFYWQTLDQEKSLIFQSDEMMLVRSFPHLRKVDSVACYKWCNANKIGMWLDERPHQPYTCSTEWWREEIQLDIDSLSNLDELSYKYEVASLGLCIASKNHYSMFSMKVRG